MKQVTEDFSIGLKLLTAGTAACIADLATFPLDTAKVRMQIAGEGQALLLASAEGSVLAVRASQPGLLQTIGNIVRFEGAGSLYGGLSAGLQRQMCFAGIRLGLYDSVKSLYAGIFDGNRSSTSINIGVRVAAGITTGALAVLLAQPTDVVKVRLQAGNNGRSSVRYSSTLQAYKNIANVEGAKGLWKGTMPNISRNAIVNVAEIVCYDIIKDLILASGYLRDGVPCHFTAATVAGLCTTLAASPVDVVKTRYMNSAPGEYKGAIDCAVRMFVQEGPSAFYKGFVPSFSRLVSWNIVLWVTYEQIKLQMKKLHGIE
ncbi:mitochondrial uncoupling protein 2-like [Pseudomyrmex gracilis]|uniref:mitochondrial uncoupling protein 2-like n=1 Tax=Pseudomyrmex gracilis TaxID=219809 RepID=UPI00099492CD|nr:mitochondrial uncoupling protein 2-like [Pseudomyrmex gracilis]XP_020297087.1 mitochondrial uncoupling protein 2-like [Pseudomyrmex gracilis]XP_020297147.1 mitochondrial uncoupling protein 2-like [Pseudomyrmex gracilis]